MNVLSLFDGISCGQVALQRAGIKVDKYFASEIDKYAIKVTQKNFPDTVQLGDVNGFKNWKLPQIDLLIGGSPCQDLSIAKKDRKGLDGERSGLFWRYVDCLKKFKPKFFLLENVASMPKEAKQLITETLGVEPIMINSALVSAQQRKRLYWTNIPEITQPEDKGILLKDVLESGVSYLDKSQTLTSRYWGAVAWHSISTHQRTMVAEPVFLGELPGTKYRNGKQPSISYRIYSVKAKSISLCCYLPNFKIDLPDGDYIIRKLTPIECERLQTLPDNYTQGISNTQRYKCLGNGWTVDVIAHILSFIPKEEV